MSRRQKIKCRCCGAPAIIYSSVWKSTDFADLYITCTNRDCGYRGVMNLTHSHTLTPSALTDNRLHNLIDNLSPDQRKKSLELLKEES